MLIAIARESEANEPRVAATPETVKKLKALGAEVAVARGAGLASGILDADYEAAGATIGDNVSKDADVVLKVRRPGPSELAAYRRGTLVIAIMDPYGNEAALKQMADAAHHARAVDGRALQPGQSGGLPGGDRRRGRVRPRLSDDDDGGRHGACG